MGRWANKSKRNTIKNDIYVTLTKAFNAGKGRNKHEDKRTGLDRLYIYTDRTYYTYKHQSKRFADWISDRHPECRHLKQCKKHCNEYLKELIDNGKSAYTISTIKAALGKLFGIDSSYFIQTPTRKRADIKRSRYAVEYDKHISKEKEEYWGKITSATGLRIAELQRIRGTDLVQDIKTGRYLLMVSRGTKGGKKRKAEVLDNDIVDMLLLAKDRLAFPNPPKAYDNHHYRALYAKRLYNKYARRVDDIPQIDRYIMRKDMKGIILDKKAMKIVSKNLGHNRIDVIAQSYLY